jgi:hypothetical protein
MNILITQLVSDKTLDRAFEAVCHKLKNSSCHNGIWDLRLNWVDAKAELQKRLLAGTYSFTLLLAIGLIYIVLHANATLTPTAFLFYQEDTQ